MSSITNVQSFLPYVFRPTYTYNSSNGFATSFNIRNIDSISAGYLTVGQLQVGDSNSNMYIGSSTATNAGFLANSNASNTIIGVNAGLGLSNSTNIESFGFGSVQNGNAICNSSFIGTTSGCNSSSVANSLFFGARTGYGSSNISNSVFIGGGSGSNVFGGGNVIAIGIGTSSAGTPTTVGSSNIFIGNSSATGFTGGNNVIIGHGITTSSIPPYSLYNGGPTQYLPSNMSNKLFIGNGSNILLTGDFASGCVSIGSTNSTPNSCNDGNYSLVGTGLQLDVARYARVGQGLGIGVDPGSYAMDVNGQLHVSDGSGGDMVFAPSVYGSSNGFLTLKSVADNGTMTLSVAGEVGANGGVYSFQSGTPGVSVASGSTFTLSNIFPSKNGLNWSGLVVGTVVSQGQGNATSNYFTYSVVINSGSLMGSVIPTNTGGVGFTLTGSPLSNIVISNSVSDTRILTYNFTLYPAF